MKFITILIGFCIRAASAQDTDGWIPLFNGQDMQGWEMHWGKDWKAENGTLACDGSERSWLSTTQSFANYSLKLEFRGAEKVNSGVFLRSEKEGQPHITGYELQIWDYQPAGYNTGSLVGSLKAQPVKIIPDRWNQYEITANGDHFVVVLNGKTLLDGHDSKHASGVIGFQCQPDNPIAFRNIQIKLMGNQNNLTTTAVQRYFNTVRKNLEAAADVMPADKYNFRLTEGQMTFAEWLNHSTQRNYSDCAALKPEPVPEAEKQVVKLKEKPAVSQALKDSLAYCAAALLAVDDQKVASSPQMSYAFLHVIVHNNEIYGNLAGYLRSNGIIPPSTAARLSQQTKSK